MKAYLDSPLSLDVVGFVEADGPGLARWLDEFKAGRATLAIKCRPHDLYQRISWKNQPVIPAKVTPAMISAAQSALCDAQRTNEFFTSDRVEKILQKVLDAAHKEEAHPKIGDPA